MKTKPEEVDEEKEIEIVFFVQKGQAPNMHTENASLLSQQAWLFASLGPGDFFLVLFIRTFTSDLRCLADSVCLSAYLSVSYLSVKVF